MNEMSEPSLETVAVQILLAERTAQSPISRNEPLERLTTSPRRNPFFGWNPAPHSIRSFKLRDVILEGSFKGLFDTSGFIGDTGYLLSGDSLAGLEVDPARIVRDSTPGTVIIGCNVAYTNYFHWMTQALPALYHALNRTWHKARYSIVLPQLHSWQEESLRLLGLDGVERVTVYDKSKAYAFDNAEYSEFLNGGAAFTISATAGQVYACLKRAVGRPVGVGRKIYVARSDSPSRRMRNEGEIIEGALKRGFEVIIPAEYTIAEQIRLFRSAGIVVGSHGAGLTNIVFCDPGTLVYELVPSHYPNACFCNLAHISDLRYWADAFESDGDGLPNLREWESDTQLVLNRLDELVGVTTQLRNQAEYAERGDSGGGGQSGLAPGPADKPQASGSLQSLAIPVVGTRPTAGKKDLIMGVWSGGSFDRLQKLSASLRQTAFNGDICAFVSHWDSNTVLALLSGGIRVERVNLATTLAPDSRSSRYAHYLEFLARCSDEYGNVMLTDLASTVFQGDPFAQPLPADLVFVQEQRLIGESTPERKAIADIYGEAVAHNLREFATSDCSAVFGTISGMLRYLVAMTAEFRNLGDSDCLWGGRAESGVHNYLVRMRPLRNAWVSPLDSYVSVMRFVPVSSLRTTHEGIQVNGKMVSVLRQWERNEMTREFINSSPRFQIQSPQALTYRPAMVASDLSSAKPRRAVIAFHHPARDSGWLLPFLATLRCVGYGGAIHCTGIFTESELTLMTRYGCMAYPIAPPDPALDIECIAHIFLGRVLDQLAASSTEPGQVLVLDSVRAGFLRNPFEGETIGLSVFHESATRIADSEFNLHRLAMFTSSEGDIIQHPVVSSALFRGGFEVIRAFYAKLFIEFIGRSDLLRTQKAIQGAVNKLCHSGGIDIPIIQHPNGAEVYFEIWEEGLPIQTAPFIRIGGTVPFAVLNPVRETELMRTVRASLDC